jgi:phosphoglycolate phosphatase
VTSPTQGLGSPEAIVFDLDGTLVDSAADLAIAVNDMLAARGLRTWSVGDIRRWIGEGAERLVARALTASLSAGGAFRDPDRLVIEQGLQAFRLRYAAGCTGQTTLYPGAIEALDFARSAGCRVAILTNKPSEQTETILRHFGLDRRLDAWLGGDSPFGRKPNPAPLRELARRCGVHDLGRVWLVGDSVTDIRTAKAAGARAIAVRGGYDDADPIEACDPRPDQIIADLEALSGFMAAVKRIAGSTPDP